MMPYHERKIKIQQPVVRGPHGVSAGKVVSERSELLMFRILIFKFEQPNHEQSTILTKFTPWMLCKNFVNAEPGVITDMWTFFNVVQ